jgi:predicted alpha/beta superfamily hydrolase
MFGAVVTSVTRSSLLLALVLIAACSNASHPVSVAATPARIATFVLESRVFQNTRTIRVWLPPGYDDARNAQRRYPVLYMNDGFAVFSAKSWNAPATADRLVASGAIAPFILVGMDNGAMASSGTVAQRTREYVPYTDVANDPDTAAVLGAKYPAFVVDEVMPAVAMRYRVTTKPEETAIGGSSYGGLAALYAALHRPDVFGALLIESTPTFLADFQIIKEANETHAWPRRVSIGIGTTETDDEALNRRMPVAARQLADAIRRGSRRRSSVKVVIDEGGRHTGASWGKRLPAALRFLSGR